MTRTRTSVDDVLASIRRDAGAHDAAVARALFRSARTAGAELRPAQSSVSVRLPGLPNRRPYWLTLFVIGDVLNYL